MVLIEYLVRFRLKNPSCPTKGGCQWYLIEGEPDVLQKLVDLGFDVNTQNKFGNTPIMECSLIRRWDNVIILLENGADLTIENNHGYDYFAYLEMFDIQLPQHLVNWIQENNQDF